MLDDTGLVKLYRVDSDDGTRSVVSNLTVGANPVGAPRGIAVEAGGGILAVDIAGGTNMRGLLVRVDPQTGARLPVSDFGDVAQGALADNPQGVAVEADGRILITDQYVGTMGLGALFRVDPLSGDRVLLSDFEASGQGPLGMNPFGVAVVPPPPGTLFVFKEVVNDNGGSNVASDWTITVTGANPSPASFPGAGVPGTAVMLDAGTYAVSQSGPAGYTTTLSADCVRTIASGETKTCTITNDDTPPAVPMCNGKPATIVGTLGPTELRGTSGNDVIVDLDGDNIVRGRGGNDTVCTGPGNDQVYLGGGADTVIDTGGQNTIVGGPGADDITTGAGDDRIDGGLGIDTCAPGSGHNTVRRCEVIR